MTNAEFKRACERAGLTFYMRDGIDLCFQQKDKIGNGWWWYEDDPALPAYVAELLMVRVREKYGAGWRAAIESADIPRPSMLATAEQRILACLEVLGE